ncbi:EcoKI restriction-modification system protein HsdS [Thalassovita autumnalis]|uniref:EcoKI restriction-modification system protein HsdS n=1 Tax=Thalassovita autumnalis TaxID=2072972 RepID=A0A0P1F9I4_9RHOB|nr:restriction endonuclease subunit S [Thalassovita autumnalis]CUH64694.1 EcoKI restriction-modification system protein HsdS [Thalassovita autumnalis]CUH70815.1 EcoKI restriction-modification system protein HsdS [Thalassovita autumnalis]
MTATWFHSLPKGWASRRIKTISPVMRGASPRPIDDPVYFDDDGEFAWVRISDVTASTGLLKSTTQRLSDLGASKSVKLESGKLFLSIAGSVGKPCITGMKACIHDGFVYFPYLPIESQKFLYWIFVCRECFSGLGKHGTQLNLNTETVGNIAIPFPDLETQRQIADFLDRETARIDLLIEKKQRLVALLEEQHSVELASLALGLAPNEKFDKDTWDQNLPPNWVATSLKNLIDPNRQITYGIVQPGERDESGILMVRGQDYSKGWAEPDTVFRVSPQVERPYARARLRAGDIVMTIVGAGVGNVAIVPLLYDKANITQTTARLAINPRTADAEYVKGVLESKIGALNVESFKRGAAQPGLMLKDVARFRVPVPPIPAQQRVASQMQASANRVLKIQTKTKASIDRLKEYRSALITAAVTGQIDVASHSRSGFTEHRLDALQEEMDA